MNCSDFTTFFIYSPIIEIPHPAVLRTWYRKRIRHEDRVKEGRESKPPPMPPQEDVFSRWVTDKRC